MSNAIGIPLPRLSRSRAGDRQTQKYAVNGKVPGFTADFIDNYYFGHTSLSSAITHARNGNATMTDGYGPELVVNGDFSSGDLTGWTDNSTGSGSVSVVNNTLLLAGTDTSNRGFVTSDSFTTKPNVAYIIELSVTDRQGSGDLQLQFSDVGGNRLDEFPITAKGRYQYTVIAERTASYLKINCYDDDSVSIDNVSVREMPVLKWAPHNLFTESENIADADWSKTGATATQVTTTLPDGTSGTASRVQDTGSGIFLQSKTVAVGQKHTIAVWAKRYGASDQTFRLFQDSSQISSDFTATEDWQLFEYEVTVATGGSRTFGVTDDSGSGAYDVIFWGIHLYRSDLGGMVDNPDQPPSRASYVPTTSSAEYLPRIGHHVYNGSAWANEGLLAESEARTNLIEYSTPDGTNWTLTAVTLTTDDAVSPDGTENAARINETTASSGHNIRANSTNVTSGLDYTLSAYVKADTSTACQLLFSSTGFGSSQYANFDLSTGTVGYEAANATATIQDVGNGWYRCAITSTATATVSSTIGFVIFVDNDPAGSTRGPIYVGDTAQQMYVYGVQVEEASTPSSLVPTSGSSVTRAAETFTIPSANLPWPEPVYTGANIVDNGDFSTTSDWTISSADPVSEISGGQAFIESGGSNAVLSQTIPTVSGNVYELSFDLVAEVGASQQGLAYVRQNNTDIVPVNTLNVGIHNLVFVAEANNVELKFMTYGNDGQSFTLDDVSVREINPLSVSIATDGRVTYADTSSAEILFRWLIDSENKIAHSVSHSGSRTGMISVAQEESNISDDSRSSTDYFNPDVLIPFNVAGRHGSTFVQGAESGVSFTADTTPTALPDLSATDLSFVHDFQGTVGTFRVWDRDITDDGLVEATNPSLEPSLSLTFEGTGTNSFVVNDWAE